MPRYRVNDSQTGTSLLLEGDSPPTEQELEQIFSEHSKSTVTATNQPPKSVTDTTPPVPKEKLPKTPTVTGFRPAIRLVGGEVVVGDAGMTHPDIIQRDDLRSTDIDMRGFVDEQGAFHDREQTASKTGLPTEREPGRQHSTDLPEATAAGIKAATDLTGTVMRTLNNPAAVEASKMGREQAETDRADVISKVKPTAYELAKAQGLPTGMESGTELTTALTSLPQDVSKFGRGAIVAAIDAPPNIWNKIKGLKPGMRGYVEPMGNEIISDAMVAATKPFVPINDAINAAFNAPSRISNWIKGTQPGMPGYTEPGDIADVTESKSEDSFMVGAAREAARLLIGLPEFVETPLGAATFGLGAGIKAAATPIRYAFAADMVSSMAEQSPELFKALTSDTATEGEKAKAIVQFLGTGAMAALLTHPEWKSAKPIKEPVELKVQRQFDEATKSAAKILGIAELEQTAPLTAEALKSTEAAPAPETGTVAELQANLKSGAIELPASEPAPDISKIETLTPAVRVPGEAKPRTGKAHDEIVNAAAKEGVVAFDKEDGVEHGFVDQNGNFVTRLVGSKWFEKKTGKTTAEKDELHSQDLKSAGLLKHLDEPPKQPATASDASPKQSVQSDSGPAPTVAETPAPVKNVAKAVRAVRIFDRETELNGPDILSWIKENGKLLSKAAAKRLWGKEKFQLNASLWDDSVTLSKPHHNFAIYSDKGSGPDRVAQAAYDAKQIKEPSVNALWSEVDKASKARSNAFKGAANESRLLEEESKQVEAWQSSIKDGEKHIPVSELKVGEFMEVDGEHIEVTHIDPDTGDVTLKDGSKFGTQVVSEGKTLHVEKYEPAPESTEFVPKAGGELFSSDETPFNLTGEKFEMVAPKTETTKFGDQTLAQDELFGIQKVVESKDPAKSADAAQQMYGGPKEAIAKLENQLRVVDSDPQTRKAFAKEQRGRLKEVIALLRQRAEVTAKPSETRTPIEILNQSARIKVSVPEGASQVRVTDSKGRKSVMPLSEVNKGDNPFHSSGAAKIEAGTIGKDRKFVPVKGDVSVTEKPKGIAASVRNKWTSATESPLGSESGFFTLQPIKEIWDKYTPSVKAAVEAVKGIAREQMLLGKTSDYRRSILHWSAKLQRSFGEAMSAQKEIQDIIPDPIRRDAVTNWIQAGGDSTILADRLANTIAWRDPVTGKPHPQAKQLAKGYEAALHLTPEELAVAADAKAALDTLHTRGTTYDVLKSFKDNYVTQIWNLKRGPTGGNATRTLKDKFRFSKASKFDSYFDGEQAGFVPKTKDISKLLPVYLHEMNSVIAARQLVEQMSKGKASDGRPLLAARGRGVAIDDPSGKASLILPDAIEEEFLDYKTLDNQPALHDWRWETKDSAGNPVFMKADLAVHPEAYAKLKNVLGKSAIKEWYESKTSASSAIPKGLVKALDFAQSETKRTMLGLLTPFHQVQEGTHAIGHRVNPFFNNPEIDLVNNHAQMDAAHHGLMLLPDRTSAEQFMEGFKQSKIVSAIPGLGPLADHYSNYLFHQYIPGIKFKTYEAILGRNMGVFEKEMASGQVTPEDVKILSAEQANAAYGHLNYADLARNPTILHIMRLGLLAPDFLEARFRFSGQAIKGLTGGKVGREQLIALTTLAVAQASLAWILAKTTGGQWDAKDPFTFHVGNRKFTMRSVPEDSVRLLSDTRAFAYARLNPVIGRGAIEYLSGTDWRGQKVTAGEVTKNILQQPIPLALRPLFGTGNSPLSGWEQLAGAAGLKITRYSAQSEIRKKAHEWMAKASDPKILAAEQRYEKETLPDSDYKPLREALINKDYKTANTLYDKLRETRSADLVNKAFNNPRPFSGSAAREAKFKKSLNDDDQLLYEAAKEEQRELRRRFRDMKSIP